MMRIPFSPVALLLAGTLALGLVGCGSPPPEPTLYLLRPAPVEKQGRVDASFRIGLGRVVPAPYLMGSPGIVVETAPGEVRPAALHQWAEPLDAGIRWFLRDEVSSALGYEIRGSIAEGRETDYRIDVYVSRLHGTLAGYAIIEAGIVVWQRDAPEAPAEYHVTRSSPLEKDGYAGLVEAEKSLLRDLAGLIADAVRELTGAGSL